MTHISPNLTGCVSPVTDYQDLPDRRAPLRSIWNATGCRKIAKHNHPYKGKAPTPASEEVATWHSMSVKS